MKKTVVHIIGGGLAGLAAAMEVLRLGGMAIIYEASPRPGGRCRSFDDPLLGNNIDNGAHLVLSANHTVRSLIQSCGAENAWVQGSARFWFFDLDTGQSWSIHPNRGPLPWWLCIPNRRVPGVSFSGHLKLLHLLRSDIHPEGIERLVGTTLFRNFVMPVALAITNTPFSLLSWDVLRTVLLRTFAHGAQAIAPLVPRTGYGVDLIAPLARTIQRDGGQIYYESPVQQFLVSEKRITAFQIRKRVITPGPDDKIIAALPIRAAQTLLPDIPALPTSPIINAYFRLPCCVEDRFVGIIGGVCDWIQVRGSLVSASIGTAHHLVHMQAGQLLSLLWQETVQVLGLSEMKMPPARLIKERDATLMLTPAVNSQRQQTSTKWENAWLAGDWTATGLPCTLEGAALSGINAARAAMSQR